MKDGLIQQVGAPKDVYDEPDNIFVGGFIVSPAMNFLTGKLEDNYFVMNEVKVLIPEGKLKPLNEQDYNNQDIVLGIRPEDIHDEPLFIDSSPETKIRSEEHTSELQSRGHLVCRLLLEKKKTKY